MKLLLRGHTDRYAMEQLQMALFPEAPMEYVEQPFSGDGAVSTLSEGHVFVTATAKITRNGQTATASRRLRREDLTVRLRRRILQQSYYLAAVRLLPAPPPWGAMAGVRPTKLSTQLLLDGGTAADCDRLLREVYFVSQSRRRLCVEASTATQRAAAQLRPQDVSLYIGIPFCPSRCAYCSFVSASTQQQAHLVAPFLDALEREIQQTGRLLAASGRRVRTVYMGGGTPTTLSASQLARLMEAVRAHVDLSDVVEYTVEGGRPDTLDLEKLQVLRQQGADRVSINPQTMQDDVLRRMGRLHTAEEARQAYASALEAGFSSINMDLIAGLPGDTAAGFADSLAQCLALGPTNLTVHTLALKRGASLSREPEALLPPETVAQMLETAETALRAASYRPYYLYRQKYMSGSFENVGWCREGYDGLYNIYMMEELHTIVSVGGGGMSKLCLPGGRLERWNNPKFPKEYLDRLEDTLEGHRAFFQQLERLDVKTP